MIDMNVVVGGTDTNQQLVYVNGRATGDTIMNKANLNSINNRQVLLNPLQFPPGAALQLYQAA